MACPHHMFVDIPLQIWSLMRCLILFPRYWLELRCFLAEHQFHFVTLLHANIQMVFSSLHFQCNNWLIRRAPTPPCSSIVLLSTSMVVAFESLIPLYLIRPKSLYFICSPQNHRMQCKHVLLVCEVLVFLHAPTQFCFPLLAIIESKFRVDCFKTSSFLRVMFVGVELSQGVNVTMGRLSSNQSCGRSLNWETSDVLK